MGVVIVAAAACRGPASVVGILCISLIIQVKVKPFRDRRENTMELLSLVTLIFGSRLDKCYQLHLGNRLCCHHSLWSLRIDLLGSLIKTEEQNWHRPPL